MKFSKQYWRVGFDTTSLKPFVATHTTFGWKVHQHVMPVGSTMSITALKEVPRAEALNRAFYVGGEATVINNLTGQMPSRVPGIFTGVRPPHPVGITTITPVEELEFWCFNKVINKGKLPVLNTLILEQGEVFSAPIGQRVLICKGILGDFGAGDSFIYNNELIANTLTYCFLIGDSRV